MRSPRATAMLGVVAALTLAAPAAADVDLKFGGMISSDIRYRLGGEALDLNFPSQQKLLPYGFSRNENTIKARLSLSVSDKVKAVADVDMVLYGFSDLKDIDSATLRERVDPYRFEVHAAYIDIYRVVPGLDLRIGRQTVVWGVADQFNPTSNVNTLDFSDPLLFGRQLANNMIRADYNPKGDWVLTGVVVPIFRPAELPRTAPIALLSATDRPAPVQDDAQRLYLWNTANSPIGPQQVNVFTLQPEPALNNVQFALRAGGRLLGQDVSLSYYHGRFGIPTPVMTVNHLDRTADVLVAWPRMDVLGADVAGTIDKLAGMGYWIEGALVFPQFTDFAIYDDRAPADCYKGVSPCRRELTFDGGSPSFGVVGPSGRYTLEPGGSRSVIVPTTPFVKLTVGGDLSLGSHVYVNMQYLHGFIDEFGAGTAVHPKLHPTDGYNQLRFDGRIGDYIVAGIDVHLFSDRLLARLFGVIKLPSVDWDKKDAMGNSTPGFEDYKFTGVLFPQLVWSVWDATELTLGAFIFLGDRDTKFGDPAAGASEIFMKAKFSY